MVTADYLRQQRSGPATIHLYQLLGQKDDLPSLPVVRHKESLKPSSITMNRRAEIVYKALLPEDRESVQASVDRLKRYAIDELINNHVQKVNVKEDLYILRNGDFRILLLLKREHIEVQDIFRRNRLTQILNQRMMTAGLINSTKAGPLPRLLSVSPDETVAEVLAHMDRHGVTCVPVIEEGKPVGSVRENRLLAKVLEDRALLDVPVSQLMETSFPVVDTSTPSSEVARLLQKSPAVLVEEIGRITGIITNHDVPSFGAQQVDTEAEREA